MSRFVGTRLSLAEVAAKLAVPLHTAGELLRAAGGRVLIYREGRRSPVYVSPLALPLLRELLQKRRAARRGHAA